MKTIYAALVALSVTGCASTATKNALQNTEIVEQAYGQVVEIEDADNRQMRSLCLDLSNDPASQAVCVNLKSYDVAKVVIMRVNRYITWLVPAPKSQNVQKNSFLEFAPTKKMASFVRIAAPGASESCKWEGPLTYQFSNSAAGTVTGFVGGMLIVPAVVGLGSDTALEGGVICDGWTYKSLLVTN